MTEKLLATEVDEQYPGGTAPRRRFVDLRGLQAYWSGVHDYKTLWRWAKAGKIPARCHNGQWVVDLDEVDAWSNAQSTREANASQSVSKFQRARLAIRSLTTEVTAHPDPRQKGTV